MKWFVFLLLSLIPLTARAADLHCGRDTDRNGAVAVFCTSPDEDFDGYASVATGGNDCDDLDSAMFVGVSKVGASANTFKTCQSDGTFTVSAANSTYAPATNSGANRWVGPDVATCGHAGTLADPNNLYCHFNPAMSGYVALSGDDAVILSYGSDGIYDTTWGSPAKMIDSSISGSSGHMIHLYVEPGKHVTIIGQGTSPTAIKPMHFTGSYWDIQGNDYLGYAGLEISGGYAEAGIYFEGSSNNLVTNAYIHNVDGNCTSNNCGGLKWDDPGSNNIFRANHIKDVYQLSAPTNHNNANIIGFRGTGNQVLYNILEYSSTAVGGEQMYYKHCATTGDGSWVFKGNIVSKGNARQLEITCGGGTVENNIFLDCNNIAPVSLSGGSGATFFAGNTLIQNNTAIRCPGPEIYTNESYENSSTFGNVLVKNNVWSDNKSGSYGADGSSGFYRISHYGNDVFYDDVVAGGKILFDGNCLYNSTPIALFFTIFGKTNDATDDEGTTAPNCAGWQALGLGLSTNEHCEDPQFNASNTAQALNCSLAGWRPSTSPAPTPTPGAGSGVSRSWQTRRGRF